MNSRPIRLIEITVLAIILHGCSQGVSRAPSFQPSVPLSSLVTTPGEKLAVPPAETAKQARCQGAVQSGAVFLEQTEVTPSTIVPGEEIHHRLVYVVCPRDAKEPFTGKIIRTVQSGGKQIAKDTAAHMFKPGTWAVDVSVVVPPEARPGEYHLNVTLQHGKSEVKRQSVFLVQKQK